MHRNLLWLIALVAVVPGSGLFGGAEAASAAGTCPNEALRSGPSAGLPECRGYEMVSPVEKNGYDALPQAVAASAGPKIAIRSFGSFAGSASANLQSTYLATLGPGGAWSARPVSPALEPYAFVGQAPFLEWSPDLSQAIVQGSPNPGLTPDARPDVPNLYLRDNRTDSYLLETPGLRPIEGLFETALEPTFGGSSSDFSHLVFGLGYPLTGDSPPASRDNIYDFVDGRYHVVGVLPDGAPDPLGVALGSARILGPSLVLGSASNAVSDDGSTIFFTSLSSGGLFARVDGTTTVPVSASQKTPPPSPNPPLPATYWTASTDGSVAFFTSKLPLTDASNTGPRNTGNDLYRFDLGTGQLVDLSVDATDPNGAEVLGVVGTGADGSYVYFVAKGQLDGVKGTLGGANLYVSHGGSVEYIATLSSSLPDSLNWFLEAEPSQQPSRVSPDGKELLITTQAPQPGYDNTDPASGVQHTEVYRFDAELPASAPGAWTCVSCDPSGAAATGDAAIVPPHVPFAASHGPYLTRAIGPGHRPLFFNTADALVPQDVNQVTDVYEWQGGQVHLISTGTSGSPSYFSDADESGENVFIATRSRLVPADHDDLVDIYDARVGGGTAPAAPAPPPCSGESCRGAKAGDPFGGQPQSSTFSGPGNPKPHKPKPHKHRKKRHHRRGTK
ncbi:MAG TPA: hypothetical protein VHI77_08020 [Solirubrobacterales bacterium]|nr:hypothetical protein [Solirubrobacterales bacterium]